ncbi:sugar phosphate isomerase/epimerase [Sabulilitoribacter multivorans]|uniref:Sugar phosphate isomerase/epimerase n=1 Tax=Flaviramulus multivorans TaxID=1304750 RepID=A0ABS9IIC2_9FLAO|nr:TIM barrel protein [Flaviramulus multivorans]MCF7560494.1 sugar phosphate isomerase/epimerase [Flaviramulus multivorans]
MKPITRREFTKKSALAMGLIPLMNFSSNLFQSNNLNDTLSINIFSKHLQFLDYYQLGEKVAEMGFQGVDLTVRPKGHVLPEHVINDLPKAIENIKKGGSQCNMITTAISSAENKTDVNILKTAAENGIKYYRTDWFKYSESQSMNDDILHYQQQIKNLSLLNKQFGIIGCYQNHAGRSIGASIWEVKMLLELAETNYFGTQYDIRHAMVEGGLSWENGLKLIKDSIKSIVLKDYKWEKVNGQWLPINMPIGEGMVDFKKYFSLLKKYQINVPVSLHLEYDLGGAEKGNRTLTIDKNIVYNAMKKDLNTVQRLWLES